MSKLWDFRVTGCPPTLPEDPLNAQEKEKCRNIFDKYDKDQSGKLDKAELTNVLGELNLKFDDRELYEKFVEKAWEDADSDDSDRVDYEEFLVLFKKVFAPANRYGTQLRKSCGRGEIEKVKELVSRGCHPNCADGTGYTSLHHAAEYGRCEVIQLLFDIMGDQVAIDAEDKHGWTPLMSAASMGMTDACALLKKLGADMSAVSTSGRTALHWAASKGHEETVKYLLSQKADLDVVDNGGWSAINCAALHDQFKTAKALLDSKASTELVDKAGYTVGYTISPFSDCIVVY
jgi:ankyrin repeat protein